MPVCEAVLVPETVPAELELDPEPEADDVAGTGVPVELELSTAEPPVDELLRRWTAVEDDELIAPNAAVELEL